MWHLFLFQSYLWYVYYLIYNFWFVISNGVKLFLWREIINISYYVVSEILLKKMEQI